MTIVAFVPFLVSVVGLLLYLLAPGSPRARRIGELMFFAGLLVFLFSVSTKTVRLG